MKHKHTLILLALGLLALQSSILSADPSGKPNFLFIITDDQAPDTIHALGNDEIITPNLDRLATGGTSFMHCYNQGSWSGAVCIASRTMLNTGRSLFRASRNTEYLNASAIKKEPRLGKEEQVEKLWGEVFIDAGYKTFQTGKWHNSESALLESFDHAEAVGKGMYNSSDRKAAYLRPTPENNEWTSWDPKWGGFWKPIVKDIVYEDGEKKISEEYELEQHTSELFADKAVAFLEEEAKSEQPFFMYLAFNAPHDPRQAPKEFLDMYPHEKLSVPANFLSGHPFDNGAIETRDEKTCPFPRTPELIQIHKAEYYAMITHMDHEIGRVLDALEASGRADNTYIIMTSDHGLAMGMHGLLGKQNLYEHSVNMPFIVKGPGVAKGRTEDRMFYMQSVYATTCELAGLPIPDSVDFESIAPLITGSGKDAGEEVIFGSFLDVQRSVRTQDWKLIYYPKLNKFQLFDMNKDPLEIDNLADNPEFASKKNKLIKIMHDKQEEFDDYLRVEG